MQLRVRAAFGGQLNVNGHLYDYILCTNSFGTVYFLILVSANQGL